MRSPLRSAALARARRYRRISADPSIAARTHFFAAAAVVTRALATRDQPEFLARLGARLEAANLRRAREICDGRLYRRGTPLANTGDFVKFEQALVETELDRLRARDEPGYLIVVACANEQIDRASRGLSRWLNRDFARAVISTKERLGRRIDFARRDDRERLGIAIAWEARRR